MASCAPARRSTRASGPRAEQDRACRRGRVVPWGMLLGPGCAVQLTFLGALHKLPAGLRTFAPQAVGPREEDRVWHHRPLGRGLLIGVVLLGTSACGLHYWGKPGSTTEEFERDSRACAQEAVKHPAAQVVREEFDKGYHACLKARGYERAQQVNPGPGWHRGIE